MNAETKTVILRSLRSEAEAIDIEIRSRPKSAPLGGHSSVLPDYLAKVKAAISEVEALR
jgi:hypothetical protein